MSGICYCLWIDPQLPGELAKDLREIAKRVRPGRVTEELRRRLWQARSGCDHISMPLTTICEDDPDDRRLVRYHQAPLDLPEDKSNLLLTVQAAARALDSYIKGGAIPADGAAELARFADDLQPATPPAPIETPDREAEKPKPKLYPCDLKAWTQYQEAIRRDRRLQDAKESKVYQSVKAAVRTFGDEGQLPDCETWCRYVRKARSFHTNPEKSG